MFLGQGWFDRVKTLSKRQLLILRLFLYGGILIFWFGFSELVSWTNALGEPAFAPFYAYGFMGLGAVLFIFVDPLVWIWLRKQRK